MKLSRGEKIFNVCNVAFLILLTLLMIYPIVYVISASLSSGNAVVTGKVVLFPVDFDLTSYKMVLKNNSIWIAYANSIFYTVCGTLISVFLTICGAYPLSKERLRGRKAITFMIALTLWFTAGMIPMYLNFRNLGLLNTRLGVLLHGAASTFNFILMKNFFQSIPKSLEEAANIDGANDYHVLFKIFLPLSLPSIATIALFFAVARWNEYLWPMLLVNEDRLMPLQVILKKLIIDMQVDMEKNMDVSQNVTSETVIYATIVIAALPMLLLYPFIQKYFVKGVMVGSIKG